jgi:MFS family permease
MSSQCSARWTGPIDPGLWLTTRAIPRIHNKREIALSEGPADAVTPSLWRNTDYVGWWIGNTLSILGTSMSTLAFPLLILFRGGSVTEAGLVTAADMIGLAATTLLGGAIADRFSRKAILVVGPLLQAVAMAALVVVIRHDTASVALLFGFALGIGAIYGLTSGAMSPALRRIVPRDQVATATAAALGRDAAAELVGGPLAGVLFSVAPWLPFLADAGSYLFATIGSAAIRRKLGPERGANPTKSSVIGDIRSGLSFVKTQPFLRFVVVWGSLLNIIVTAIELLFIALVRHRGGGPTTVGVVSSVALAGAVIGAVIAPGLLGKVSALRVLYVAQWSFVAAFAVVAVVPRPWEIGVVLFFALLTVAPLNVVLDAYVVRLVPDEFTGRVSAVVRFGTISLQWIGPLLAGGLASLLGIPLGVLALAAATVPLAVMLHVTSALDVLEQPVGDVEEFRVPVTVRS